MFAAGILLSGMAGCHRGGNAANGAENAAKPPPKIVKAPPIPMPTLPPDGIRGIYLTGWTAGLHNRLNALCGLCDRTEINAMVIDVKDDGQLSYNVDVPLAQDAHASLHMYNVDKVIATLNEHHIWPIARIACMRDTPLAKAHPELAVHGPDGKIWHDRSKHYWLNPYKKEVWDYNVDVALDAIKHGFKEIQFDYVRFPSEGKVSTLQYPGKPEGSLRADQIAAFMKYAEEKIHARGAWFSADVFGHVATMERRWNTIHRKTIRQQKTRIRRAHSPRLRPARCRLLRLPQRQPTRMRILSARQERKENARQKRRARRRKRTALCGTWASGRYSRISPRIRIICRPCAILRITRMANSTSLTLTLNPIKSSQSRSATANC